VVERSKRGGEAAKLLSSSLEDPSLMSVGTGILISGRMYRCRPGTKGDVTVSVQTSLSMRSIHILVDSI